MTIHEAKGFQNNLVYPFDKIEPFEYIERFKPLVVPEGVILKTSNVHKLHTVSVGK